jgi:hypothetical protein
MGVNIVISFAFYIPLLVPSFLSFFVIFYSLSFLFGFLLFFSFLFLSLNIQASLQQRLLAARQANPIAETTVRISITESIPPARHHYKPVSFALTIITKTFSML